MLDPSELDLQKTSSPLDGDPRPRSRAPWLIAAVAALAIGVGIWFFMSGRPAEEPAAEPAPDPSPAATPAAGPVGLCEPTEVVALPALDDSDTLVGALAGTLSTHSRLADWLATDGLIRNFAVVVENISSGVSPAVHLSSLRPAGEFRVTGEGQELFLDPRSYERYALIAAAVDSVDPQAAAQLCGTLKPRLEEAYDGLGRGDSFDNALEGAVVAMLRTPALGVDVRLVPNEDVYAFSDEALESLTPPQKHLARMGALNTRLIQDKLRQIALAIGIPRERLPE